MRKWSWTHKWSSIICTLFMLMLCITGLPLIFHEQIDDLQHDQVEAAVVPEGTPPASLDRVVASAVAAMPGQVPHFLIWDRDDPNAMLVSVGRSIDANPDDNRIVRIDAHTGAYLDAPDVTGRFTSIMLKLHTDMFAGLPGKLFLGLMGILFCVAVVSGIAVYAPPMQAKIRRLSCRASARGPLAPPKPRTLPAASKSRGTGVRHDTFRLHG
ncbi:PepSY-associated TM helix domain-containing protein [Nitrobacter sp. TKz-YC01]|uniref:PepSY-associated TM helix domain-containing protein n=1 Tax=Nitrobacter sp. TKz-YC01 TaxID=3398703 RepID=UPI003A0FB94C